MQTQRTNVLSPHPVLLFDGECGFCDSSVRFLLRRDTRGMLRFAPLQSRTGLALLAAHGLPADYLGSAVLIAEGRAAVKSDAILGAWSHLQWPWRWLTAARLLPRRVRDWGYDFIAARRHWFGKPSCALPRPEWRARFLDGPLAAGPAPTYTDGILGEGSP